MVLTAGGKLNPRFFAGKRVFVTGHNGFKGSWLSWTLLELGADVTGFARAPDPNGLFQITGLDREISCIEGDVADYDVLSAALGSSKPDIVFHLAAQALVLPSYADPIATFQANVVGTIHVLEALRYVPSVQAALIVSSDKCYRNHGVVTSKTGFGEDDPLGGRDPYSASKAMAELATESFACSFLDNIGLASARAGNVIGGGDMAPLRVIPDAYRAMLGGTSLRLRNPETTRPWQHVLDVITGYLILAQNLCNRTGDLPRAFNFGPPASYAVRELVECFYRYMGEGTWSTDASDEQAGAEATSLSLDSSRAADLLGWRNRLDLDGMSRLTAEWYAQALIAPDRRRETTVNQVRAWLQELGLE